MAEDALIVRGAREHNLRNIDVTIPRDRLTVITGLSGSGKSSLAFDTIYAEGQRRYVESLSAYARQFLGLMEKPDVDSIEGLSPAISIEQKTAGHNPRSTVGTVTEIYDYLRLLYARAGTPHCPNCGRPVQRQSAGADRRHRARLADGHQDRGPRAARAGAQGRVPRAVRDRAQAGLRSRLRRRRADRGRGSAEAQSPAESHDLGRRRPARRARRGSRPPRRLGRDGAQARRRGRRSRQRRRRSTSRLFSERYGCPICGISLPELEPRHFSFNSPFGACPTCGGLGTRRRVSEELILGDPRISILEGVDPPVGRADGLPAQGRAAGARAAVQVRPQHAVGRAARSRCATALLYGDGAGSGKKKKGDATWEGVLANVERRYDETDSDTVRVELEEFMVAVPCTDVRRPAAQAGVARRHGRRTEHRRGRRARRSPRRSTFFETVPVRGDGQPGLDPEIAGPILKEVRERLRFLVDVGLDYLTLGRAAESLSGGEAQRIRLATQIGSRLVGVLYILDEPSIGLHQRDNARLLATLEQLRDLGNTVIVVEHDEETMRAADHVIDLGPGRGQARRRGDRRRARSTRSSRNPSSITGKYLSGELEIAMPAARRRVDARQRDSRSRARASTTCATSTSRSRSDSSSPSPASPARASRRSSRTSCTARWRGISIGRA